MKALIFIFFLSASGLSAQLSLNKSQLNGILVYVLENRLVQTSDKVVCISLSPTEFQLENDEFKVLDKQFRLHCKDKLELGFELYDLVRTGDGLYELKYTRWSGGGAKRGVISFALDQDGNVLGIRHRGTGGQSHTDRHGRMEQMPAYLRLQLHESQKKR